MEVQKKNVYTRRGREKFKNFGEISINNHQPRQTHLVFDFLVSYFSIFGGIVVLSRLTEIFVLVIEIVFSKFDGILVCLNLISFYTPFVK